MLIAGKGKQKEQCKQKQKALPAIIKDGGVYGYIGKCVMLSQTKGPHTPSNYIKHKQGYAQNSYVIG